MARTDVASLEIATSPDAIYRAFADPEALMTWLPPGEMTGRALEYDFREGGAYRIELAFREAGTGTGKTTSGTDISHGRFLELEPSRRIVQSVEFESKDPALAGEMTMTWTFEPVAGGTCVTVRADDVPAAISKRDHDAGLRGSLDNLSRYLLTPGRAR